MIMANNDFEKSYMLPELVARLPVFLSQESLEKTPDTNVIALKEIEETEEHESKKESMLQFVNSDKLPRISNKYPDVDRPHNLVNTIENAKPFGKITNHIPNYTEASLPSLESNTESFFFSLQNSATIGSSSLTINDEDIAQFDSSAETFSLFFDGSDVGLGNSEIAAFDIISQTEILLSFTTATTIEGISFDDSDIVLFRASQLGNTTAGSFELFLDGSAVGLTTNGEDIDALHLLQDGSILISTLGSVTVPGLSPRQDEDILKFNPNTGDWSVYFDGSDVDLDSSSEDVKAIAVDDSGNLYLSTVGNFTVPSSTGTDEDVSLFRFTTTGANTSGSFDSELFVDGSGIGITGDIRGLDLAIGFGGSLDSINSPPTPSSEFDIEIDFTDNNLSASQRAVFTTAANRWEKVIIGDLPDILVPVPDIGLVDDVNIKASAPAIDGVGKILGRAGPTRIRSSSLLPVTGVMEFDQADVDNLETNDELLNVILHEMGHVLGIGTLWPYFDLLTGAGSANPRYTGANATAEYNAIFGLNESGVPVENNGGQGTRDAHWRESVFDNEIMTGYLDSGVNPLSRITIASLEDMGYEVDLGAADFYAPSSSLVGSSQLTDTSSDTDSIGSLSNSLLSHSDQAFFLLEPTII